jgi:hypothetical protein
MEVVRQRETDFTDVINLSEDEQFIPEAFGVRETRLVRIVVKADGFALFGQQPRLAAPGVLTQMLSFVTAKHLDQFPAAVAEAITASQAAIVADTQRAAQSIPK